jgi:hypothetical protein
MPHQGRTLTRAMMLKLPRAGPGPGRRAGRPEKDCEDLVCDAVRTPARVLKQGPAPAVQWKASGLYKYGYPGDPQIAASSTHIVVTNRRGISFYDKSGALLQTIKQNDFFPPVVGQVDQTYPVDRYNDLRTIFDPFRKRFWIVGLGIHNDYKNIPKEQRPSVVAAAVSLDENPQNGFHVYWWPGVANTKDTGAVGGLPDYAIVGVDQTAIYVTHKVSDDKAYWRVAFFPAGPMASGQPGSQIHGWQFWDLKDPDGSGAFTIQPAVIHGAAGRMFFASTQDLSTLVVWALDDPLGPGQKMSNMPVPLGNTLADPVNAMEKNGGTTMLGLKNLGVSPVKAVWRAGTLYFVLSESHSVNGTPFTSVRLVKLDVSGYPSIVGLTRKIKSNAGHYSWPAVEVNKLGDVAVVHQALSPNIYPGVRYTAWLHGEPDLRESRLLKAGDSAYAPNSGKTYLFADIAGASVDFLQGKEASGIWIAEQYAGAGGDYDIWVAKVLGSTFADLSIAAAAKVALAGNCFAAAVPVVNRGDGASGKTDVAVALNGAVLARQPLAPLRPRGRRLLNVRACVPPGTAGGKARVELIVDAARRVVEYDEGNNAAAREITIAVTPPPPTTTTTPTTTAPPATTTVTTTTVTTTTTTTTTPARLPDLVIVRMTTTSYTVENVGESNAGHFLVTVSGVGTFEYDGLGDGKSKTETFRSPCSRAVRSAAATADARNEVAESDEGNNTATASC